MGRELKRVPMDFNWPIGQTWSGYLMPNELHLPTCTDCGGDGYSVEAKAVANTFYSHQIGGQNAAALAWHDKLGQAEVDHLVEQGRLRVHRDGKWVNEPRTAAEVNAEQHGGAFMGHDAINRMVLIEFRCNRLGIHLQCRTCKGHGDIGTDEQRDACENWEPTDPPEGGGYQLWETTSEGSPVSPVFSTLDELCEFAADHCTVFGSSKTTAERWRSMLDEEFVREEMVDGAGNTVVFI